MSTLPKIKTLDQLKRIIHTGPGYEGIAEMLLQIDFDLNELSALCKWNDQEYQKITIDEDETFRLMLMCWEPGQESPVHDHASGQGWIYVVSGELTETLYYREDVPNALEVKSTEIIKAGKVSYMNDNIGIHRIGNTANGRTISLHYYSNPTTTVQVYDELSGKASPYQLH